MKTVKNCTAGIAVLLCVLICIYTLTLYLKFTPEEPEILEDGTEEEVPGKLEQFLEKNVNAKEHLNLAMLLMISALVGFLLEKLPALGMLSSSVALSYALTMMRFSALPKFPRTVVVLCIAHTAGAVFYAATSERGKRSKLGINSAATGALLCNTAAIGISLYLYRALASFGSAEEKLEEMKEAGLVISEKFAAIPDVIDMIYRTFQVRGTAQARMLLSDLAKKSQILGLSGLEFAAGIPGTVGGGLYMNAGAYGGEMAQVVTGADIFDGSRVFRLSAEELELSYRRSLCMDHPDWLITRVELKLTLGDPDAIRAVMDDLQQRRRDKQPLSQPSAGSFFKRPQGDYAARLIEAAGLKGFRVGGAAVSDKHAGFVVNLGNATAKDVLSLMEQVQERVEAMSGIRLSPEVRFVGVEG